jgi:hypothetical protein
MDILPSTPIVFDDGGWIRWGIALSPVFQGPAEVERDRKGRVVAGPWPMVLIRVRGADQDIRVPARDVEVWLPGIAAAQARAANS